MPKAKIMIVEDEAIVAEDIRQHIVEAGYEVDDVVHSGEKALQVLEQKRPDLILMDIMLNGQLDGIDVAEKVKERYRIPIVFLSAYSDDKKLERARQTESYGYLIKPFDDREIRSTLTMALYKAEADKRIRENQRWIKTVLKTIECGVITVDVHGNVVFMNPYAETLVGHELKECANKSIAEVLCAEVIDSGIDIMQSIQHLVCENKEAPLVDEYRLRQEGEPDKVLYVTFSQLRMHSDEVDGVVIGFTDITHLKNIEAELRFVNIELSEVMSTRTEILMNLNNDLEKEKEAAKSASFLKGDYLLRVCATARPVCNSVLHTAELMKSTGELTDSQREQVEKITVSMQDFLDQSEDIQSVANIDMDQDY